MNNNEKNKEYIDGYNDMFSEKGLDEMQLAQKYKIGFKLFRALFWVQYAAAIAVTLIAAGLENNTFVYIGAGLLSICTIFYIVYLYKIASEGLMNAKFASSWNKMYLIMGILFIIFFILVWLINLINKHTDAYPVYIWIDLNLGVMYLGTYFCARKNMKVLKKMLKDTDESEEE